MNIQQIQELFVENINQNSKICTAFMQFVKLFSCNRLMFSVVLVISELLIIIVYLFKKIFYRKEIA